MPLISVGLGFHPLCLALNSEFSGITMGLSKFSSYSSSTQACCYLKASMGAWDFQVSPKSSNDIFVTSYKAWI